MENNSSEFKLLPLWSVHDLDDDDRCAVRVIASDIVACDHTDPNQRCDDSGVFYSGWTLMGGPLAEVLCPRHWYERHFRFSMDRHLEDMTDEQYQEQLLAFKTMHGI